MTTTQVSERIGLKNILFLTDFSEPSESALPFAIALARKYGAKVHALHVLIPEPYTYLTPELATPAIEGQEEGAQAELQRVEARLTGVAHESSVVRGSSIWPATQQAIEESGADLIVLGTHGRTGAQKLLLGSVAEEIFRQSPVPVLTIGPWVRNAIHGGGHFHRVLFATDFTPESLAAAPYAISMAQENEARLTLLHVIRKSAHQSKSRAGGTSVAHAMHELLAVVPSDAALGSRPEALVEYGEPFEKILHVANEQAADLIVLGVRGAAGAVSAATHLGRNTAHRIVAHARCPVLTVRG
jgi:nucleotide-binding universal stress UspA family protein